FFAAAVALLEEEPEIGWLATEVELVDCHREVHPVQLESIANSLPSNVMLRRAAADLLGGFPESPVFRAERAGEDIMFRICLKRWFRGMWLKEKLLRYRVSRGSHFDYFLDRTTVERGELVFTTLSPDEESGALSAAKKAYVDRGQERVSVLSSLKGFDDV